ncbi:hypothetical protein RF11_10305 [Thelohanellus kitauei]|uniref:Uncharacterized protein n=1 Tax=Thelohanellus kitauei TaxID=669202 RepID=A0A0C2MF72_THEKT|nr:hypothetical protein RF11_10305 [Thelohanellus kitauei]
MQSFSQYENYSPAKWVNLRNNDLTQRMVSSCLEIKIDYIEHLVPYSEFFPEMLKPGIFCDNWPIGFKSKDILFGNKYPSPADGSKNRPVMNLKNRAIRKSQIRSRSRYSSLYQLSVSSSLSNLWDTTILTFLPK